MNASEQVYRLAGQVFGVRSDCPRFLDALGRVLEPFAGPQGASGGLQHYEVESGDGYVLRKGRRVLFRCAGLDDALEFLEAEVYAQLVRLLDRHLLFHAGAVARAGALLMLPASPGGGKTTLAAGLIKRGCQYLTDEMLILDPRSLRVRPFPKALNMKHGSIPLFPVLEPELRPARPRGELSEPDLRIHHLLVGSRFRRRGWLAPRRRALIFPAYRESGRTRLEPLDRVGAIRRLAAACYNHYRFGARFLTFAERLTRGALCAALEYGALEEALEAIDRQVLALAPPPRETPVPA